MNHAAPPDPPEHPTLSTEHLLGLQHMEPASWSRLVNSFGPIVYRWFRCSGVPESDAADLVQEVFASVAGNVASFHRGKQQGSFRSWLATITRNKARDYFRRSQRRQIAEGGTEALNRLQALEDNLDSTICTESIASPLLRAVLHQVRAEFEPQSWDAFWQTTIDGQSASEVAKKLGVSVASVYQSKSRVLRRLRKYVTQLPD